MEKRRDNESQSTAIAVPITSIRSNITREVKWMGKSMTLRHHATADGEVGMVLHRTKCEG
jgi:hypothetical protein